MLEKLDSHKLLSDRIDREIARQDARWKWTTKWAAAAFLFGGLVRLGVLVFIIWGTVKVMQHFQIL